MINIEGTEIEHVDEYKYIGQNVKVSKENQITEISRRVKMGWAAFERKHGEDQKNSESHATTDAGYLTQRL
ncbi:unnamed protein product [Diabrotica balteata]|uniref:Uncharacterized protein n=1 Tax=Diabrotica balteata TaxID=107213 RepID=A0A9N9T836_DIABA|nr:unnamed protein product [Diabrotica balteata]